MSAVGGLRYAALAYFSKPVEDRSLYRMIRKHRLRSVLEVGIGSLGRAVNLIGVCQRYSPGEKIRYAAVDWFEQREATQPGLTLIQAHRTLNATGAKVRILPSGPAAVEAVANSLPGTDLILISADYDDQIMAPAWFFVPRMCHGATQVLRAQRSADGQSTSYQSLSPLEIEQLAQARPRRRAA